MILLVDDDPLVRELVRDFLEMAGHTVVEAPTAEAALQQAGSIDLWQIELAVTDLALPGLDGAELAKRLRQFRPGLPVLLISGNPLAAVDVTDERTAVLSKPFTRGALLDSVKRLLGSSV